MAIVTLVPLTEEERSVLLAALSYYRDTLTECVSHNPGQHGNEADCEGWGPRELATLDVGIDKVTTA